MKCGWNSSAFMLQDAHGIHLELGLAGRADNFLDGRAFTLSSMKGKVGGRLLVEQGHDAPLAEGAETRR